MSDYAIKVEGLGKKYLLRHQAAGRRYVALRDVLAEKAAALFRRPPPADGGQPSLEEFWALKDVSFEVKSGAAVGIIGRNGAGKSTLLKLLSRITEPTTGRIRLRGRVASLLEVGTGFHPELTGRENIYLNGAILGMNRLEIKKKFDEIVDFAEVEKFLDTPVKRYSSGMYMRLAFAVAAHLEPEILIVDEVLAVGDMEFQKKCLGKMEDVSKGGRTVLFVSHNMDAILRMCSQAILLKQGSVAIQGPAREVVGHYTQEHASQPAKLVLTQKTPAPYARRGIIFDSVAWSSATAAPWTLPFGEPISFSVSFECLKNARFVELGLALYAPSGTEIASTSSIGTKPEIHLARGCYTINVCYQSLKLVPNTYTFGIGIKSEAGCEDHFPKAFTVDVVPSPISSRFRTDSFEGYIVPDVLYELAQ
jgi:lipopolysaccharide transport system ATP-binding protein